MKEKTCCFFGHRYLPKNKIGQIKEHLDREVENLVNQGVTNFISGGAPGFDQLAASSVIDKKTAGENIRLIFALPYRNQEKYWDIEQQRRYHRLLLEADEIVYSSEMYTESCIRKRNRFMIEKSAFCICAYLFPHFKTVYAIHYALKKGLTVINIAGK